MGRDYPVRGDNARMPFKGTVFTRVDRDADPIEREP